MIRAFCDWLAATELSITIQSLTWIVPAVQTVHILLIAAVMATALLFNLRLLGVHGTDQPVGTAALHLLPAIWFALPGLALTGIVLIIAEPARELRNPAFAAKMALLALVCAVTLWVGRRVRSAAPPGRGMARCAGAAGLLLWVAILAAGRWIAYLQVS